MEPRLRETRDYGLDAVKGLFILLVIIGHMPLIQGHMPETFLGMYRFHVAVFLMLVFLQPARALSRGQMADRMVRYGVPFLVFYTFYWLVFTLMQGGGNPVERITAYGVGLAVASTRTLDAASGLKMMWFLPTLLTLTLVRSWLAGLPARAAMAAIGVIALGHTLLGLLPEWRYYIPWGLVHVVFILPLGLLLPEGLRYFEARPHRQWLLLVPAFMASQALGVIWRMNVDVGDLKLFGIDQLPMMLVQDVIIVSTTLLVLCQRQVLARARVLVALGTVSLPVYLIHPLLAQAALMVIPPFPEPLWWVRFLLILAVATGGSYLFALALARFGALEAVVFPRDRNGLAEGFRQLRRLRGLRHRGDR